jgi:hypothetical protein
MLTIQTEVIANAAYNSTVALLATVDGYKINVNIEWCTPKFRLIGREEETEPEVYSSLEWATVNFQQEAVLQYWNSQWALNAQKEAFNKAMSPQNQEYQLRMGGIMQGLSTAVPLEMKPTEGTIYLYHGVVVHETSPWDEAIKVSLSMMGEVIWEEETCYDGGYIISPEIALYQYFFTK